jgi:LCP family protein required for cell wall assembly
VHSSYHDALTLEQRRELLRGLHERQERVCFICQRPLDLDAVDDQRPVLEHIQPLEDGGTDEPANLALLHADCADQRPVRDLGLARALAGFDRVRDERGEDPNPVAASTAPGPIDPLEPSVPASETPEEPMRRPAEPRVAYGPVEPLAVRWDDPDERSYGAALGLTVLGAVVPGSAYLAAGRRRLGMFTVGVLVLLMLVPIGAVILEPDLTRLAAEFASRPALLEVLGFAVLAVAAGWVAVIATGHRMLLPSSASRSQEVFGAAVALVLAVGVVVPSVIVSRYAFATHDLIESVFDDPMAGNGAEIDRSDPWKDIPRLNLLVLGGDSTPGGGITTNTMIVISVDTTSGEAVLIGLPRNLQNAPIPEDNPLHAVYPTGYTCGEGRRACLLSGLYTEAKVTHAGLFDDDPEPGLTTLRGAIHEITGLEITYHLLVDLAGFEQIVDALGGIDVNVGPEPVPVVDLDRDGNPLPPDADTPYIPPGPQHLDGAEALAFARERGADGNDTLGNENRLRRHVMIISAIVERADPVNLLLSYLELASTASDAIRTDVPVELLPALVDLSQTARTREVPSLPLPANADLQDPDFEAIREFVQDALAR